MADAAAILGIVSLVVSLIAFVLGVFSTITSYASTADGYRRCKESIMGPWGRATHRVWTFDEFRLKVMFLSPVIFVAPPSNTRGPVKGRPIFNVDGTAESYHQTRTRSPPEQEAHERETDGGDIPSRVYTADDELASWVLLLQTLQKAEAEGRAWDHKASTATPKGAHFAEVRSTLVIQVQERKRSWDQMPSGMQKPFATSTISHVAEMAALLGMVWTVFNQDSWVFRAEGNGLVMTSSSVSGLGVAVTFVVTGGSKFQANRTIPCPSVKEYLFGNVPTILTGLPRLRFGCDTKALDETDITRRTLRNLNCSPTTIERYFHRREHIRSVSFEVIGMVGEACRLRGSNFKRMPNPTPDTFHKTLSVCTLMTEFQTNLQRIAAQSSVSTRVTWVLSSWRNTLQAFWKGAEEEIDVLMRETVHDLLDECTEWLCACDEADVIAVIGAHITAVLEELDNKESFLSSKECGTEADLFEHYFDVIRPTVEQACASLQMPYKADDKGVPPQDIWVTLLFRSCLWSLLHDFDEFDEMILPSRLVGSRLPVYIL